MGWPHPVRRRPERAQRCPATTCGPSSRAGRTTPTACSAPIPSETAGWCAPSGPTPPPWPWSTRTARVTTPASCTAAASTRPRLPQQPGDYRIEVSYGDGAGGTNTYTVDDPYRWLPTLGELDQYLIGEGRHERLWDVLGAHVRRFDTPGGAVEGVSFAVWAPNARGVKVTGDFDYWQARAYPMRSLGSSGVWEIFIPGIGVGSRYRYHVLGADGEWREKSDPLAFATEVPPANASIVTESSHEWSDDAWLEQRAAGGWHERPMSIYEVHAGSWRQGLSYRELADELVDYVVAAGFTHIEFMPLAEHPFGGSWGYQVTSYYAPTSRFGSPDDLRYLIDRAHQAGIGVIVDWVPAHFPKDDWALARFDGTPLYEHPDPRRGEQLDWGTYVFDFGRTEVRNFLVANALYWCKEFHVDGIRVDAVASMLYLDYSRTDWAPNIYGGRENLEAVAFLQEMNATVYREVPGCGDHRRGVDGVAGRHPARRTWAASGSASSGTWAGCTTRSDYMEKAAGSPQLPPRAADVLDDLRVLRELRAADQPRRGRLRQGLAAAEDARATAGSSWPTCAPTSPTCGPTPASSCCSWARSSPRTAEWAESRSLDWWHLDDPANRGVLQLVTDLNARYRSSRRSGRSTSTRPASSGSTPTTPSGNVLSFLRYGRAARGRRPRRTAGPPGRCWPAWPTSPAARTTATGSACREAATGARCSTPTPRATAAPASATSAASRRSRSPGTASRTRPRCRHRRWARSGSCTRARTAQAS